jgi:hypothetical protein
MLVVPKQRRSAKSEEARGGGGGAFGSVDGVHAAATTAGAKDVVVPSPEQPSGGAPVPAPAPAAPAASPAPAGVPPKRARSVSAANASSGGRGLDALFGLALFSLHVILQSKHSTI